MTSSRDFELIMAGYGLTTAEIFYRLPDFPGLLQTYIWQDYDQAPDFPRLFKFLDFWKVALDGKLHSVVFNHNEMVEACNWRVCRQEIRFG